MHKTKLITGVLLAVMLLIVAGCQAEPETTTVMTTTTVQAQTITITDKVTAAPQTNTVTITTTKTVTTTVSAVETTAPTTTPSSGFDHVSSPDGKLQIVEAEYTHPATTDNQVFGQVLNLSDETLNAQITVEFLNYEGGVHETVFIVVNDLGPGEQKNFRVYASLYIGEFAGFNISVEVSP